jgi:hypothetical protein
MADADITDGTPGAYHKDCWLVGAEGGTVIKGTYSQTGAAAAHGAATFYGRIADKLS